MITSLYNSTFSVYKPVYTAGLYGNTSITYSISDSSIDCYITYLAGGKTLYVGREQVIATHRLFCNPVDIKTEDRIYVDDTAKWYNVLYVDNSNVMDHHYEVFLESIG